MTRHRRCQDCDSLGSPTLNRRDFVKAVGAASAIAAMPVSLARAEQQAAEPESLVKKLYESLSDKQREKVCFPWDHTDDRGLLRTHVSNNWSITDRSKLNVAGSFYTGDQQELIEALFFGMYAPEWHDRIRRQLMDDAGGYGKQQTIAIFGEPGTEQFQFVMTGRHLTIRCDGNTSPHVAFGGPIFYGHASTGSPDPFHEEPGHPGNVYWPQAVKANKLYQMLDGRQREQALVPHSPSESAVGMRGPEGKFDGIAVAELSTDQKEHVQDVLKTLLEPYRLSDRTEALQCLDKQGGLDRCSLAFYADEDVGGDGVWDVWRLEGPSFVWHFRGNPHVHVWVNVADDPNIPLNAIG